jgi:ubiquinone/menaquinone biosynthesis C-methylase UbiE
MNDEQPALNASHRSAFIVYRSLVGWAFERFYREFAWTYDTVAAAVSGGRWPAWGRTTLPYLSGRVLELGCGTGNLQRALAQCPDAAPVGVDASAQMLGITARKLAHDGHPALLVRAAAQSLPFHPGVFDAIVSTFPSSYIVDWATMPEARRVLRPGGRMVVALAASFDRDGLYERLVGLAYRLTLQRSPRPRRGEPPRSLAGERLAHAGFAVAERWEPSGDDYVHLVIGTRI